MAPPVRAHVVWDFGDRRQAALQGPEVEARATGEDRVAPLLPGRLDLARGFRQPGRDRPRLLRAHVAVEPVRNHRLLVGQGPGGQDAQGLVDLKRIGVDDDAVPLACKVERQGRLAAGGGACNKQRAFLQGSAHMDSVLVLIAAPGSRAIDTAVLEMLRDFGGAAPGWLDEGEAAEVAPFARQSEFIAALASQPIDANVISARGRKKRLLIADMDSTMIQQECIDELGIMAGVGERIKDITLRAMRGELDFEGALKERVKLLQGLDETIIAQILSERITYMPGGRQLIATMKANGADTALVSGGFTPFTAHVAQHLGFDQHQANTLIIEDGKLAGTVGFPILGQQAKVEALHRICADLGIARADAVAVGDGANDVPMLLEAGLGVALHAKPKVQEAAPVRINHGDLTALLFLQGYRRSDFAA
jgi:phosphoserine phosphatase